MIQAIPTKEPTITIPVAEYQKMFAAVAKLDEIRKAVQTVNRCFDEGRFGEREEAVQTVNDLLNGLCE